MAREVDCEYKQWNRWKPMERSTAAVTGKEASTGIKDEKLMILPPHLGL